MVEKELCGIPWIKSDRSEGVEKGGTQSRKGAETQRRRDAEAGVRRNREDASFTAGKSQREMGSINRGDLKIEIRGSAKAEYQHDEWDRVLPDRPSALGPDRELTQRH
jgi:hypothetical protein